MFTTKHNSHDIHLNHPDQAFTPVRNIPAYELSVEIALAKILIHTLMQFFLTILRGNNIDNQITIVC